MDIKILEQRLSDECGCPEEELQIGMCVFTAHLEPDGTADLFLDLGDYQEDRNVKCGGTVEGMRNEALKWAEEIHQRGLN